VHEPTAKQLRLEYTRRELAEMIGVSTETAIRLLAKFKREKVISISRRDIVLNDLGKLARIANHGDQEG
jgi:CRP-like cAMP-binding protein